MQREPDSLYERDSFILAEARPESKKCQTSKEGAVLFGDDGRQESLKQTIHELIIWGVRIAAICLILSFIIRVFHLAAPKPCLWLDAERLQKLDGILFSGALGAFISRYLGQTLSDEHKRPRQDK